MDWKAKWITGNEKKDVDLKCPTYHFLSPLFRIENKVKKAVMYVSSLGIFTVAIDGKEVSEEYFSPGYTQYTKRVLYKAYDVTEYLDKEQIQITAEVAGGWYTGQLGLTVKPNRFGNKRAYLMQLQVEYQDGTKEFFLTDEHWRVSTDGPRKFAGFFDGEIYDARREISNNWNWRPAVIFSGFIPQLEGYDGSPVLKHQEFLISSVHKDPKGNYICDLGRNFAGVTGFTGLKCQDGENIVIRHAEVLNEDGSIYTNNLRKAKATLHYTAKTGIQDYVPRFTYMGFRYIEISGTKTWTEDEIIEHVRGYELYSDMEETGTFYCSDPNLNKLHENIRTSLKANFMDIPTDCPQRDERCGWTGDIAMFISTATYLMDTQQFFRKWLRDVELAQKDTGAIPYIVPDNNIVSFMKGGPAALFIKEGTAAWGDAVTLIPWNLYWTTGDSSYLKNQYSSMKKWVTYIESKSQNYLWNKGFQYGDWLAPLQKGESKKGRNEQVATAFFAHSAWILSQSARILGYLEEAAYFNTLFENIKSAFRKAYIKSDGHFKRGFQTIYTLGIYFDLLSEDQKKHALNDLVIDIEQRDYHLGTGFVGTPFLCFVLSDGGRSDVAYRLLLQDSPPSWLYPVKCGATSIWERWDSLKEDGTVKDSGKSLNMVSFNHYAYGVIGDWMHKRIGGLEALTPGYQTFRIAPVPGGNLTECRISLKTVHGMIKSEWKFDEGVFYLCVTIPSGTTAQITMPDGSISWKESGEYMLSCPMEETKFERN